MIVAPAPDDVLDDVQRREVRVAVLGQRGRRPPAVRRAAGARVVADVDALARERARGRVVDDRLDLQRRRRELGQQPVDAQRELGEAEDLDGRDDVGAEVAVDVQQRRDVDERGVAAHDLAAAGRLVARDVLVVERGDRAGQLAQGQAAGQRATDDLPGFAEQVAGGVERLVLAGEDPFDVRRAEVQRQAEIDRQQRLRARRRRQRECDRHRRGHGRDLAPAAHCSPVKFDCPDANVPSTAEARG